MSLRFLAAGALILLTIGLVGAGAAPPTSWLGVWVGNDPTDPGDGSNLKLIFKPSGAVTLIDDSGTICDPEGLNVVASGSGSPDGDTNDVTYDSVRCAGGGLDSPPPFPVIYTYDAASDTLMGHDGSTFARP